MNKCTEGWPNAPGDVSPDAFDAFLTHVAGCPFHEKVLDAEEEKIRSKFRLARGLDPLGRLLVGTELKRILKTHDRNHVLWKQAAQEMKRPFKRIYLSNRGDVIAQSGRFYLLRKYEGNHALNREAGLQVWGVIGEGIPDVFLGLYSLIDVEHTGEEQFLQLENEYTVGLRVEQVSDDEFDIGFRCVENDVLERERAEAIPNNKQEGPVSGGTSLPLRLVRESLSWVVPSWRWATAQLRSLAPSLIRSEPLSVQNKIESCALWASVVFIVITAIAWYGRSQLKVKSSSAVEPATLSTSTNAKPDKPHGKRPRQVPRQTTVRSHKADKRNTVNQSGSDAAQSGQDVSSDSGAAPNDKPPSADSKRTEF